MLNTVNDLNRNFMRIMCLIFVSIHILLWKEVETNSVFDSSHCGGVLNQSQGIIQTPNFPGKFKVPIKCKWVIDASSHLINTTVTIHLTQLYVTTGLKFSGLPYYDPENTFGLGEKFGESPVHNVSENNVLTVNWLKTDSQVLVVNFELNQLEGNHIRALDNLLDVYGFNITYQVRQKLGDADSTCSVVGCSYNGHCFANQNFSEYRCSCFHGFSGKDCGQGLLCRPDRNPCMNNGTCRHVGSSAVICNCPASYTGSKCEIAIQPPSTDCSGDEKLDCDNYCPVRQHEPPCTCKMRPAKEVSERSRYQIAIQAATQSIMENSSSYDHLKKTISSQTLSHQFEKSITKYLKSRIPSFETLKILNVSFDGEIIFHIFAGDNEDDSIKQSIGELVELGSLDNFTFTSAAFTFIREPALFVKEVSVSQDRRSVRYGDEFIITCIAYGSQHITFRWLKNDILINIAKATREMSIIDSPNHLLDHYTSVLSVKSADSLDSGLYTCQAIDWGTQHCKSVKLDVISPPTVKVTPLTASIQKGQALNIICTWSMMNNDSKSFYGYSWLKERKYVNEVHLFKMKEDSEVWEDLQPVGSILRVYNIQKSTKYTCQVQSNAEPVEASVDVEVLNKSSIPWCESDDTGLGGIRWAEIGAWGAAKVDCPARYTGVATRLCSVSAPGKAAWLTPDYSNCISEDLDRLAENFKKLTLGYGSTTGAYTMSKIYELLRDRSRLYPGEGETFLTLMQNISWYLNFTMAWKDLLQSTPAFYNTINIILQHSNSIINSQRLIDLQNLVNHWTINWAKHSRINRASVLSYDSLMIHTYCFNSSSTKLEYTFDISGNIRGYQSWSRTAVNILVARESLLLHGSSYSIAIIIYKDLMKYLPERQIYKMDDGSEQEFEMTGNVVSLVGSSPMKVMVDIRMATATKQGWNMTCGAMTAPSARWLLEKCTVNIDLEASITRCTCPMLATITALLTKTALQNGKRSTPKSDVVLILGCLCCIFQCALTTVLLLMRWYNNPSCLIFLKLQCCISVTAVAMVFFSIARSNIKESSYPFIVFALEAFFLLGLSSHLTKLLLVYTEIIYLPKVKDMKLTVVGVINGFTLLIVLCNHISYNSTRWRMESWWLIKGTFVFYAFIICITIMSAMFLFLYVNVMKRLAQLLEMKSISKEQSKAVKKRVCLLGRAALIFITILVMTLMSIVYVNYPCLKSQYAFSLTCAFTGFVLLACYVLQSETSLHLHVMDKIGAKDVCTSDSESNILNFFTKQDGETESECAPPPPLTNEPLACQKESIQLKEISLHGLSPTLKEKAASNTKLVTFQTDLVQECGALKYASTLPKRRPKLTITRSESISNISGMIKLDHYQTEHQARASSTHRSLDVLQSCQHHQDVLTTRVCVELGLVTNGDKHDNTKDGPSIVLCSVDIEPCPGKVVELNEVTVKTTTTDVNGNGSTNSLTVSNMNINRNQDQCSNRPFDTSSQLDNDNGNCSESVKNVSRTDHDVFNRISSDLHYLLQDYDSNGNTNKRTVQVDHGTPVQNIRSSDEDDKNEEHLAEGKTSL